MSKLRLTLLIVSDLFLSNNGSTFAQSGAILQFSIEKDKTPPQGFKIKASSGNLAIGSPSLHMENDQTDMVFKGDNKEMIAIDHEKKSYMVINGEMIAQMKGAMSGFQKEMEEVYKNMPPEAQEQMKKAQKEGGMNFGMGGMAPKEIKAVNSGEKGTQAGYSCVRYDILEDGQKKREIWIAPWSSIEGGAEVKKAMMGFMTFMQQLSDEMTQGMPGGGGNLFDDIDYEEGMPVMIFDLETKEKTILQSAKKMTLPANTFGPPAGYKPERSF
ncbi:MAG: hypothetical protein AAGG75_22055 [Bacteroidota bacterium]